jgi:hypothetical protein
MTLVSVDWSTNVFWLASEVPDVPIEVRSSLNIQHSLADVCFRAV